MKKLLLFWLLLKIHKSGLCKPFHYSEDTIEGQKMFPKGWCPVLAKAYMLEKLEKTKKE